MIGDLAYKEKQNSPLMMMRPICRHLMTFSNLYLGSPYGRAPQVR
jgi:hypothetical protein